MLTQSGSKEVFQAKLRQRNYQKNLNNFPVLVGFFGKKITIESFCKNY